MQTCSRKIHFCYGHRMLNHEGKCASFHGHNGIVWIYATALKGKLDKIGRVIDFSVIKEKIGGWVEDNWDHTMILSKDDKKAIELIGQLATNEKKIFILPNNPTAENMAIYLLEEVAPKLLKEHGVVVNRVDFYETENCMASATLDSCNK